MNLYQYSDYRIFLKAYYFEQKRKNAKYSYRVFANKAKLASPNYLKLVIDGKRRVTDRNLQNFIRGLGFQRPEESEYFKSLVYFQESRDRESREIFRTQLEKIRTQHLKITLQIQKDQQEYLMNWRHFAIREMVLLEDFKDDPVWISKRLKNAATPDQVCLSLALLVRLGMIHKDNGKYKIQAPLLSTTDEVPSLLIKKLHEQFLNLAIRSLYEDEMGEREVNGLTIAIPRSKISDFKKSIKNFRKEMNKTFSEAQGNQEVYQLMIGFYPLTKKGELK